MRFPAVIAWISLLLASGGAAADRIVGEKGRELLGPDGRTLIDKQDGFSIVLPAADWKVHLKHWEGTAMDAPFTLLIANPAGDSRVRVIGKIYPKEGFTDPLTLEMLKLLLGKSAPREKVLRNEIIEVAGTKCLEREWEFTYGDRVTHDLARTCDQQDLRHKLVVATWLGLPVDRWPAEEKVLREMVESFRVLR